MQQHRQWRQQQQQQQQQQQFVSITYFQVPQV
jgi:hypothetical protein